MDFNAQRLSNATTSMRHDADVARRLSMLCDICERRPRNQGYSLCQTCFTRNYGDARSTNVPAEEASYEELLAWCKEREEDAPMNDMKADRFPTRLSNVKVRTSCSICLDDYQRGDTIMTLNCLHYFHESCIREWILKSRGLVCPVCQHDNS